MAAFKWTMRFNYVSGLSIGGSNINKAGGWSESYYSSTFTEQLRTRFGEFMSARAGILSRNARITGYRIQPVDPSGRSQLFRASLPGQGGVGNASDVPQMAILAKMGGVGVTNGFIYRFPAIADGWVLNGELVYPDVRAVAAMNAFFTAVRQWQGRGVSLLNPLVAVKTIDATGAVTMQDNLALAPGQLVAIRGATLADGNKLNRVYKVDAVPNFRSFTLSNYTQGAASGGQARKVEYIYPLLTTPFIYDCEVVLRKIGRPSKTYAGRRGKRRS